MESAAGLGALGFWLFLGAIVVAGIWFDWKKRESQQETLRRVVESGQAIDSVMIDKMLAASSAQAHIDQDLKVGGVVLLFIAQGLTVLGWFLSKLDEQLWGIMLGVSGFVGFLAVGLLVAGKAAQFWQRENQG